MTLEQLTAQLNAGVFWSEFTFSERRFCPRPKEQVELADGIVKFASLAYIFQIKERVEETSDEVAERQWFRRKVLDKAVSQIKSSARYLEEVPEIELTNKRGYRSTIRASELRAIKKILIYRAGRLLPVDCSNIKFYHSNTVGFIHLIAAHDYLGVLDTLIVPDDIFKYFEYRESVLPQLLLKHVVVEEPDIMVGFLTEQALPVPDSYGELRRLIQDRESFDLSKLMLNLHDHIVNVQNNADYTRIMEEFARVPRSVWREFKIRFLRCLEASKLGTPRRSYRFAFPRSDCTFMIASMDPDWPATGSDGVQMRTNALTMFTEAAKYELKTRTGVGLLISRDNDYFQLDWCLVDRSWAQDAGMEKLISDTPLFGPVKERELNSFFFHN